MVLRGGLDARSPVARIQEAEAAYYDELVGSDEDGRPVLRRKYRRIASVEDGGMTYEAHEYDGPLGCGFIIHEWRVVDGVSQHRQGDFGPEGRTHGWEVV